MNDVKFTICIPSKGRPDVLLKLLEEIYRTEYDYAITIEKQDMDLYEKVILQYPHIQYIYIANDRGTGYCRKVLANFSILKKNKFTIYFDDNIRIKDFSKFPKFIEIMNKNSHIYWLSGFGAFWGLVYPNEKRLIFPVHRFGGCLFGIKTECLKQENWDENMKMMEDTELCIRFIRKFNDGIKHLYIYRELFFRKKRHQKGGAFNLTKKNDVIDSMANYINEKYGEELVKAQYIGIKNKKYHKKTYWKTKVYNMVKFENQKELEIRE